MNFGELTAAVGSAGLNYVQSQIPGGSPAPVSAPAPMGGGSSRDMSMGTTGWTLSGIVIGYFILRFLNLLPRWMRII